MSAPPTAWLSNSAYNKFKGSYFNTDADISQNLIVRNGNLYMPANSSIYSPNNRIYFNETYYYTNFASNVHIFGTLQLDRSSTTYDVGYEIVNNLPTQISTNATNIASNTSSITTNTSNISSLQTAVTILNTKTTNISYASSTNTTSFTGTLSFPTTSIDSGSIQNNNFLALSGNQSFSGNKTSAGNIILSSTGNLNANGLLQALGTYLRVDGELRLGTNTITISQATLQKLQYLSNVTTDISGSLTTLQNNINAINTSALLSTANTWSQIQTFSSAPVMSGASITASTIPNSALATTYVDNSTAQTVAGIKTFSSPPVMSGASISSASIPDSALVLGGAYVNLSTAQTVAGIKTFSSPPVMSGASITASTIANASLATQYLDLTTSQTISGNKTITGNLTCNSLTVTPTQLGYVSGVTSAIQTQLNATAKFASLNIFSVAQVFSNNLRLDGQLVLNAGALAINNSVLQSIQYLSGVSTNIATSLSGCAQTASTNTFSLAQTFSNNIQLDGSLLLNAGALTISNSVLQSIQYLSGVSSNIQTQFNSITTNITALFSYQPVGVIITSLVFVPSPFLLCDGSAISRTTYSALFTAIGTTYGAGNGSTTFSLPNFQGMFLRGQGTQTLGGVAYTSGATIATFQADSVQDHIHAGQSGSYLASTNGSVSAAYGWNAIASQRPNSNTFANTGLVNASYRSSTETRPANYGVYYYIKCL